MQIIYYHLRFASAGTLHSGNDRQGDLALFEVIVHWLAELRLWGPKIEGIVGHLEGQAEVVSKSAHACPLRRCHATQHCSDRTAGSKQRGRFQADNAVI